MKDMMNMVKQAQQMKKQMAEMQTQLAGMQVEGEAGNGAVKITVTGENKITRVQIDPDATQDTQILEDLVAVATNNALQKVQTHVSAEMKRLTGGQLPF